MWRMWRIKGETREKRPKASRPRLLSVWKEARGCLLVRRSIPLSSCDCINKNAAKHKRHGRYVVKAEA